MFLPVNICNVDCNKIKYKLQINKIKLNLGFNFEVMNVTKNRRSQNCQRYTHKHIPTATGFTKTEIRFIYVAAFNFNLGFRHFGRSSGLQNL